MQRTGITISAKNFLRLIYS